MEKKEVCKECGSKNLFWNKERGEIICKDCGFLWTKNPIDSIMPKKVEFVNCDTNGDNIEALARYFTNSLCGEFVLERALEEVKNNNKEIKQFAEELLKKNR